MLLVIQILFTVVFVLDILLIPTKTNEVNQVLALIAIFSTFIVGIWIWPFVTITVALSLSILRNAFGRWRR